jgi:citrate lyase beta subunit
VNRRDVELAKGSPRGLRPRRSVLFCPGSRPERFQKALASGADAVCLDLEDGVGPDAKDLARDAVAGFLSGWDGGAPGRCEVVVRVNEPGTRLGSRDLEMLAGVPLPHAVMVPKVGGLEGLLDVADGLARHGTSKAPLLLPLIETALGLERASEIASADLPLGGLVFGGMDLAAELGARFEWEPLLYARSRIVHAAAIAGVGAIDVPWAPLDDPAGLEQETRRAARLGFTGKLAIHPAQVEAIHRGFAPEPGELAAARRVVEAAARSGEGVVVVDGRMVDRPVVLGAERILARAGEHGVGGAARGGGGLEPEARR